MVKLANNYYITKDNVASSPKIALNMLRSVNWQPKIWQGHPTLGAYIPKEDIMLVQAALENLGLLGGSRFGICINADGHSKADTNRISVRLSPSVAGRMSRLAIPQARNLAEIGDEFKDLGLPKHRYKRSRFDPFTAAKAINDFHWQPIRLITGESALQATMDEETVQYVRQKVSAFDVFPAMTVEKALAHEGPDEWRVTLLPKTVLAMAEQGVGIALSHLPKPSRHR